MGKMKPSKIDQALKQIAAIEKDRGLKPGTLTAKLPTELEVQDCKNHFHVALVKEMHDSKNRRYIASVTVQTFGKGPSFDKLAKNYKTLGFTHAIVIHDPLVNASSADGALKGFEKNEIADRIRREEEEAKDKRIQDRIKEEEAKAEKANQKAIEEEAKKKASEKGATKNVLKFEGVEVTEANVEQFAKDNQVDISSAKSAEGKLELVKKFIDSKKD